MEGTNGAFINVTAENLAEQKAKALPCAFNNFAVFYGGKFVTVNLLDAAALQRMIKAAE